MSVILLNKCDFTKVLNLRLKMIKKEFRSGVKRPTEIRYSMKYEMDL